MIYSSQGGARAGDPEKGSGHGALGHRQGEGWWESTSAASQAKGKVGGPWEWGCQGVAEAPVGLCAGLCTPHHPQQVPGESQCSLAAATPHSHHLGLSRLKSQHQAPALAPSLSAVPAVPSPHSQGFPGSSIDSDECIPTTPGAPCPAELCDTHHQTDRAAGHHGLQTPPQGLQPAPTPSPPALMLGLGEHKGQSEHWDPVSHEPGSDQRTQRSLLQPKQKGWGMAAGGPAWPVPAPCSSRTLCVVADGYQHYQHSCRGCADLRSLDARKLEWSRVSNTHTHNRATASHAAGCFSTSPLQ